jgi:hypothetical protein
MSGTDPLTPAPPTNSETVTQLKQQIASRTYRVDSQAVAREMLFKRRMMRLARNLQRQQHMPVSGADAPSPEYLAQRRSWSNPDASRTDPSE